MSGRYGYAAGYGGSGGQQQQHPAYQGQQAGQGQQAYAAAADNQGYSTQGAYSTQQWGAQPQAAAAGAHAGTYQGYGAPAAAQPTAATTTAYSQPAYYQASQAQQQGQSTTAAPSYGASAQSQYGSGYAQYGGQQQAAAAAPAAATKTGVAPLYAISNAPPTYAGGPATRAAPAYAAAAGAPAGAAGGASAMDTGAGAQYGQQQAPRALGYAPGYGPPVKGGAASTGQVHAGRPAAGAGGAYQDRASAAPRQQGYGGAAASTAAGQGGYSRQGTYEAPAAAGVTTAGYNQARGAGTGMYGGGQAQAQQAAGAGGAPYPSGAGGRSGFSQGPAQYGGAQQAAGPMTSPRSHQQHGSGSGQQYAGAGGYGGGAGAGGGGGYGAASEYGGKSTGFGGTASAGTYAAQGGYTGGGAQGGRAGRTAGTSSGRGFEPHPAQQRSDRQRDSHSRRDDTRGAGFSRAASKDERAGSATDRDRGWRGGDKGGAGAASRKRSRSPLTASRGPPASDKRARSATPPRSRAREEYGVRVPAFTFSTIDRDYPELAKRYAKLSIPPDFSLARVTWPLLPGWGAKPADTFGLSTIHVDQPVRFEHEVCSLDPEPNPPSSEVLSKRLQEAAAPHTDGVRYAVRVVLLQGMTQAERAATARGPHHEGGMHMVHGLRFLTARFIDAGHKRGVLGALGGMWHADLDGGDPTAPDGAALQAATIRHVKAQTGLDLSCCTQWHRVCEIRYTRPPRHDSKKDATKQEDGVKKEDGDAKVAETPGSETGMACDEEWPLHVVMFCVSAAELMPDLIEWPTSYAAIQGWREAKQAAHDQAKAEPDAKPTRTSESGTAATVTVTGDGYALGTATAPETGDASNGPTSLLPEPFIHIKGQHNAHFKVRTAATTLHSLLDYDEEDEDEPTFELCVFAEAMHELLMRDYATVIMSHLSGKRYPSPPYELQHPQDAAQAADYKTTSRRTDMSLLLAFRYFDRTGCGYIKPEDLRRILHNVGAHLPHRVVKQLVANMLAAVGGKQQDGGRLYYRDLTDKGSSAGRSSRERSPTPAVAPPPPPAPPSEEITPPILSTDATMQPEQQQEHMQEEASAPAQQQEVQAAGDVVAPDTACAPPPVTAPAEDASHGHVPMDAQQGETLDMQAEQQGGAEVGAPEQDMADAGAEPTEPVNPVESTEPVNPVESAEPVNPAEPTEPASDFIPIEGAAEGTEAGTEFMSVAVHESVTITVEESVPVVMEVEAQQGAIAEAEPTDTAAQPIHATAQAGGDATDATAQEGGVEGFEVDGGQEEGS